MNQITMKIATADVDHGMEAATSTGYTSTPNSQNRERTAASTAADIPECGVDLGAASAMSYATITDIGGVDAREIPFNPTAHPNRANRTPSRQTHPFGRTTSAIELGLLTDKDMILDSCPATIDPVFWPAPDGDERVTNKARQRPPAVR
ncbi:hypothetical protein KMZ93_09250 [Bradyrhizobium sediminis]|uniref:Uncharacterized protein n=1 Tax=Bradyrhizobium sediminis TaxID=2840469 RepID=A0A975P0X4_9BRAD|nr:hypothetical protein [Bradyrhizobium sediminis]QWG25038.1 hypothetical protein KMZ93_09250 [Bradyrhizobium sediminis]